MGSYVIGDIQGCDDELGELLLLMRFDPRHDHVYFVGDLVNRGPKSAAVLRRVRAMQQQGVAESVLGNHDFFLIMAWEGFSKLHEGDTLQAVLDEPDAEALITWLRHRPLLIETGESMIVHAGFLPAWSARNARTYASEIERELRGDHYRDFLKQLFGNEPTTWHPELSGLARARVIVNALARLRFCTPFSEMEFREKRDAQFAPDPFQPWCQIAARRSCDTHVIAGHWSSEGLRLHPNVSLIDSGCLWGGALTAIRLEDRAVFQVPSRQGVSQLEE